MMEKGRKPKKQIPEAFESETTSARGRLLGTAARLFCRYGINAVGVDTVVREADTAKATLYKNFGSKEGLVTAVLEHEGRQWRDWFLGALLTGEAGALEKLHRLFPLLEQWFGEERFFGCPFINALAEHDKHDAPYRPVALAHKKIVLEALIGLAREAGAPEPESLAHQLGLLIDGAIIVAMMTKDPKSARVAAGMAEVLLSPLATAARPPLVAACQGLSPAPA